MTIIIHFKRVCEIIRENTLSHSSRSDIEKGTHFKCKFTVFNCHFNGVATNSLDNTHLPIT